MVLIKLLSLIRKKNEPFWGYLSLLFQLRLQFEWAVVKRKLGRPHFLPLPLIVSLTSYPPRFGTLALTIKSLLSQSIYPDKVILWIAHEDRNFLPKAVLALQNSGLEIEYCDDLKSYKKIIPALYQYPEAIIVTADDDLYYWRTWLEELIGAYNCTKSEVVCHRGHHIKLDYDGNILPYNNWDGEINRSETSKLIFPTGVGGVLYPPGIFSSEVINRDLFMRLCPTADDIWLYWMALIGGASFRKIDTGHRLISWRGSQKYALFNANAIEGANDTQIENMIREFGWFSFGAHNS